MRPMERYSALPLERQNLEPKLKWQWMTNHRAIGILEVIGNEHLEGENMMQVPLTICLQPHPRMPGGASSPPPP